MQQNTTHRRFRGFILASCALAAMGAARTAHAADTCTGWGGEINKTVDLGLPATLDLTTANSTAGAVLASGSVSLQPLTCEDGSGQAYTGTSLAWMTGSPGDPDVRIVAPGLGLRLKYVAAKGGAGTLSSVSAGGYSNQTSGLNWSAVNWELLRLSDTVTPGTLPPASVARVGVGASVNGGSPVLNLMSGSPVVVSAACTLSVDKSLIVLPDTSTLALMEKGYSDSVPLSAGITCPGNTYLRSGTTLTLSTSAPDGTDSTLVGNTGTATGVGIEVLDSIRNRINASGGTVTQAPFTQGSVAMPGATQEFSVRLARLSGAGVTAGTVRGVFTLTLTVN